MAQELVWVKEVEYNFDFEGYKFKEELFSNGLDGMLYRMYENELRSMSPTTRTSSVILNVHTVETPVYAEGVEVYDAILVGQKLIEDSKYEKVYQAVYILPDTHKPFMVHVGEQYDYDYEYGTDENGEETSTEHLIATHKYWGFPNVVY